MLAQEPLEQEPLEQEPLQARKRAQKLPQLQAQEPPPVQVGGCSQPPLPPLAHPLQQQLSSWKHHLPLPRRQRLLFSF